MTLIPFYGWAAIDWTIEPVADVTLEYTGAEQNLLSTVGTPAEGTATYAVTLAGADQPAAADFSATGYKATNAADYTVWVKVGTEVERIPASIATKELTITLNLGAGNITETDYTGAVINPSIKVDGDALADPYVATWSSTIKNAGSYTVTVQKTATVDEVIFVNEEGTADFLVNKVPLNVNAKHVMVTLLLRTTLCILLLVGRVLMLPILR